MLPGVILALLQQYLNPALAEWAVTTSRPGLKEALSAQGLSQSSKPSLAIHSLLHLAQGFKFKYHLFVRKHESKH